jgi:hypothetical protein
MRDYSRAFHVSLTELKSYPVAQFVREYGEAAEEARKERDQIEAARQKQKIRKGRR